MAADLNYTLIMESGRTEWKPKTTYMDVLSKVYYEYMSAGGNWDRPSMLLLNGKIVVASGLAEIAWEFGKQRQALTEQTSATLAAEFTPEWEKGTPND